MLTRLFRSIGHKPVDVAPAKDAPATAPPPKALMPKGLTYAHDGLWTTHNAGFLAEPLFAESYRLGAASGHRICQPEDLHIEWRVYVCCWAAAHARRLGGDFVECGVSTGIVSRAVANYVDFASHNGRFWLVDTFDGIPIEQADAEERALAESKNARHYYDCFEDVRGYFSRYPNTHVIKGRVPDALSRVETDRVAYLHIDMNIAEPEVAAVEYFWGRMMTGGIIVFDDYGSMAHQIQKRALDVFAAEKQVHILTLPTGQGLLVKS